MARVIPIEFVVEMGEIIPLTLLDEVDNLVNTDPMTCASKACSLPQCMVDHTPKYEGSKRVFKGRRPNQVVGKSGIIRRDKREKVKYL
jgi:hypothetical protein